MQNKSGFIPPTLCRFKIKSLKPQIVIFKFVFVYLFYKEMSYIMIISAFKTVFIWNRFLFWMFSLSRDNQV